MIFKNDLLFFIISADYSIIWINNYIKFYENIYIYMFL